MNAALRLAGSVRTLLPMPDGSRLAPFAELLSTLQEMQQSAPTRYRQVTLQIATNLTCAAQSARRRATRPRRSRLEPACGRDFADALKAAGSPEAVAAGPAAGRDKGRCAPGAKTTGTDGSVHAAPRDSGLLWWPPGPRRQGETRGGALRGRKDQGTDGLVPTRPREVRGFCGRCGRLGTESSGPRFSQGRSLTGRSR